MQDRIDLSDEEKKTIRYQLHDNNGTQYATWDNALVQPRQYEFSNEELTHIEKIVTEWQPGYLAGGDRRWLEPLLAQLENGKPKKEP
jgi:hypothetical protein